jgi:hypothetical protein
MRLSVPLATSARSERRDQGSATDKVLVAGEYPSIEPMRRTGPTARGFLPSSFSAIHGRESAGSHITDLEEICSNP